MPALAVPVASLNDLGNLLRAHRQVRGWSLAKAAAEIGVPAVVLGSYERGQRNPRIDLLVQILNGYGLRLAALQDVT